MAVTREDVLHIAELARLGVDHARADELTKELSAILAHMDVLSRVDTTGVPATTGIGGEGTPPRPLCGGAALMGKRPQSVAPSVRGGFFILPPFAAHPGSPHSR